MSDFRVDTIPTPRIDLYGAFQRDLHYYMENEQSLPPLQRSALMVEQEKLNKFMLYVNESFIIKGFSKYNPVPEEAVDSDVVTAFNANELSVGQAHLAFGRFSLRCSHPSHLYVQFGLLGKLELPSGVGQTTVEVRLRVNNELVQTFTQGLSTAYAGTQGALFLPDRQKGTYSVELTAKLAAGSLVVPVNAANAACYMKLKTTQNG